MADSAEKRAADSKTITEKEAQKARCEDGFFLQLRGGRSGAGRVCGHGGGAWVSAKRLRKLARLWERRV